MLLTLLAACNSANSIEGIWAILLPAAGGATCQATVTHNFLKGEVPAEVEEESAWQTGSETESSESLLLVDIVGSTRKSATLVQGNQLLPGTKNEDGAWVFTWTGSEIETDTKKHDLGYDYVHDRVDESYTTLTLVFDRDILTGTWSESAWTDEEWNEADSWPETITEVGESGIIPASTWLNHIDGATVTNTRVEADCVTNDCVLQVTNDCGEDRAINGFRTGYRDDDAYDHLQGTGQPEGT